MLINPTDYSGQRRRWQFLDDCILACLNVRENEENLSRLICPMEFFTDADAFASFIHDVEDRRVFCLVSDQLDEQHLLPLNQSPRVHAIYILRLNEVSSDFELHNYHKVRGAHADLSSVVEVFQSDLEVLAVIEHMIQLIDRNDTPVTILAPASTGQESNTLNAMFMYCQLLKETFLGMDYDEDAKQALIELCKREYAGDERGLCIIDEFQRNYNKHRATWWYTRDSFVYRMLNRSLRTHDIELINKFGFYIKDLHQQLEGLQYTLPQEKFTVYRGQR